jgi:predicted negative regulator of RcsB-dependent stress response
MSEYLSDEEQVERLKRIVKTYGSSALMGVLIALIVFFSWRLWQKHEAKDLDETMMQYQKVADEAQLASTDKAAQSRFISNVQGLVKAHPDSAFAMQALLLQAKVTSAQGEWAAAEKALAQAVELKKQDAGFINIAWVRLARAQAAQNKLDPALAALNNVTDPAFSASRDELKGDILLQKNDVEGAKKAYTAAWDVLAKRVQPRELLKVKMNAVGLTPTDITPPTPVREAAVTAATPETAAPTPDQGAAS